jgi:hypothetical protein
MRHDFVCCINQILALKGWDAISGHLFHIGGTLFYLMAASANTKISIKH